MNEENNIIEGNTPPPLREIPDFLQGDQWFDEDTSGLYLDFTKPYTPPRWTLSHGGIPFAKLGDVHVISGKSGHGKTALMSQFMACLIRGDFGNLHCELDEKVIVLYIDTEQSEDDTIAVKNRVCNLAGIDYRQPNEQLKVVRLRETEDPQERWRQILKVIYEVKPTVCFLDGMLDIVNDYNDQKECQPIIRKCMMLVTHYNMSLWCVLHENPMADKMVGTLGSILQRKVTEAFTVRKHKNDTKNFPDMPDIFFEVQQPKSRGRDQEDWYFEVMNVDGWGVPREIGAPVKDLTPEEKKALEKAKEADELFKQYNWTSSGATYTDLERFIRSKGITSNRKIGEYFNIASEKGVIYKSDKRKYHYNGLNATPPNDLAESLPFNKPDNSDAPF